MWHVVTTYFKVHTLQEVYLYPLFVLVCLALVYLTWSSTNETIVCNNCPNTNGDRDIFNEKFYLKWVLFKYTGSVSMWILKLDTDTYFLYNLMTM